MTVNAQPVNPADVLDSLLGITPGHLLHTVRHARGKVVAATQGSQDLFFNPQPGEGPSLIERLLVAWYACTLTPQPALAEYYRAALQAAGGSDNVLAAVAAGDITGLADPRQQAILAFTRKLILAPVEGDRSALLALRSAGLATEEVVVLAQLIAFLSYQVRLAAGLGALQAAGAAQ